MAKTVNFSYIVLVISFVRAAQAKTGEYARRGKWLCREMGGAAWCEVKSPWYVLCSAVVCEGFDGYLNVENIAMFAGCTMVHGSITINESSFQW